MNKSFWQLIGLRRSRSFFIVLAINAAFLSVLVLWFLPQREAAKMAYDKAEQEKLALQNQIVELPKKFEQMKANEAAFDELHAHGFFAEQDRIMFRQMLSGLRDSSGVRLVAYDIKPQHFIENQALSNTDKQLLSSEVTVSLKGLTDLEMRGFVQALQQSVPGVSAINKQYFKRLDDLNDANLIKLGNGEPVDFIESGYSFNWYTLYDKKDPYGMNAAADAAAPPATNNSASAPNAVPVPPNAAPAVGSAVPAAAAVPAGVASPAAVSAPPSQPSPSLPPAAASVPPAAAPPGGR